MSIVEVTDEPRIEPNRIYVIGFSQIFGGDMLGISLRGE
jgi:predicted peptidase